MAVERHLGYANGLAGEGEAPVSRGCWGGSVGGDWRGVREGLAP